jgi:hypothetical protein
MPCGKPCLIRFRTTALGQELRFNAGLYPNWLAPSVAETISDFQTPVKQQFQKHPEIAAESQGHGAFRTDVYYRPGAFDEITIEHEALHNLTGEGDTTLAAELGGYVVSGGAASMYISQALRDNRCDQPKAKKKR